jgi:ABC-type antimicrobial peptide transport system permease subunit
VSTAFALVALALSCVGLYGLMAFAVTRRVKELGVRMALGASQWQVLWTMLRESLRMIAVGVLIGVPGALATMRLARTFLFGVTPNDPLTITSLLSRWGSWRSWRGTFRRDGLLRWNRSWPFVSNSSGNQPYATDRSLAILYSRF